MSSAEPTPPSGSSLLARLGWAAKDKLLGRGDEERASDAVKLVHAEDLHKWERFPRCQDFEGITYGKYRAEAYQLERRRRTVASLIDAIKEVDKLDPDEIVEYDVDHVEIPRRGLLRRTARLPLPQTPRPGTSVESSAGSIREGRLEVEPGWRRQWISLTYLGASRLVNAERIAELEHRLEAMTDEQRRTVEEVTASRYAHPVLFISHRWESELHPDPAGSQLRKLQALKDCFIVYDYSSFPQHPRSDQEEADFRMILGSMGELIRSVVILEAPDYLQRGWCLYEYIVSSLHRTTVCDEVQDGRFVTLRDWATTDPPARTIVPGQLRVATTELRQRAHPRRRSERRGPALHGGRVSVRRRPSHRDRAVDGAPGWDAAADQAQPGVRRRMEDEHLERREAETVLRRLRGTPRLRIGRRDQAVRELGSQRTCKRR